MSRCACRMLVASLLLVIAAPLMATEVDQAAQHSLGLTTATLAATSRPAEVAAAIDVLDPAPLARLVDDLAAAEATASASGAEARRTETLFRADTNVAARAVEAAHGQAAIDAAHVRQLHTDLALGWGSRFGHLDSTALQKAVAPYVNGEHVLLRAQVLRKMAEAPTGAGIDTGDAHVVEATVLGRLPQSTTGVQPEWLLDAEAAALVPGMHISGSLHDGTGKLSGLLLPRAAIVRWNGLSWTYVQVDATHFERRPVKAMQRLDDGWLVEANDDLHPGDRVVVAGAAALLAIEAGTPAAD
jgi:hypothetical protein